MAPGQWKVFTNEFPCLWNANHPDFKNNELRALCFERLLEKCNAEGDPMEMDTLKQRVNGLCIASLWQSETSFAIDLVQENSASELNNEEANSKKSSLEPGEIKRKTVESAPEVNKDLLIDLALKYPCIWNPLDSNYQNYDVRRCCKVQVLNSYNSQLSKNMTLADLERVIKNITMDLQVRDMFKDNKLFTMALEFRCFWDHLDFDYKNSTVKNQCLEQLLEKFNNQSEDQISMEHLRTKIEKMRIRTYCHMHRVAVRNNVTLQNNRKLLKDETDLLLHLAEGFPCLWDDRHEGYKNVSVKARGWTELLEKYNTESTVKITVVQLMRKLFSLSNRLKMAHKNVPETPKAQSHRLLELAEEFPYLWDTRHVNAREHKMRRYGLQRLLEKYNAESVPITVEELKKKLKGLQQRLRMRRKIADKNVPETPKAQSHPDRLLELAEEFPYLWDTRHVNAREHKMRRYGLQRLLEKFNAESAVPITVEELKKKLRNVQKRLRMRRKIADKNVPETTKAQSHPDRLLELAEEFPYLWDTRHVNARETKLRRYGLQRLLEKYNAESAVPITVAELKEKLRNVQKRLRMRRKIGDKNVPETTKALSNLDRLLELAEEFPYLWDTRHVNARETKLRRYGLQRLLEKYNAESAVPITVEELKKKLVSLQTRLRKRRKIAVKNGEETIKNKNDRLLQMAEEFPYLLDRKHLLYHDRAEKSRGRRLLLGKYNAQAVEPITMQELVKKLYDLRHCLARRRKRANELKKKEALNPDGAGEGGAGGAGGSVERAEASRPQPTLDDLTSGNSSDSEPLINLRQNPEEKTVVLQGFEIVFNWCSFCGEIRDDCINLTDDKSYVATNTTALTINELCVQLDFSSDTTPQTVCQRCDTKLQEIYDFVKLVKKAQDKFDNLSIGDARNSDNLTQNEDSSLMISDSNDDDRNLIINSLSVISTRDADKTVSARKRKSDVNDVDVPRKKCSVSINLNNYSLSSFCEESDESNEMYLNYDEEADSFTMTDEESVNDADSLDTLAAVSVDASTETTRNLNESNETVVILKDIIELHDYTVDEEKVCDAKNDLQQIDIQQNYDIASPGIAEEHEGVPNSVSVIDKECAAEVISAVETTNYNSLDVSGVAKHTCEHFETLVVKDETDLTDIIAHQEIENMDSTNKVTNEIDSLATHKESLKEVSYADSITNILRTNSSEHIESVAIAKCIDLADDVPAIDVQPDALAKLQTANIKPDAEMLVSGIATTLPGSTGTSCTQKEASDTTGRVGSSISVNQSTNGEVFVIPKNDLVQLVESIVGRMLNK